MWSAKDQNLPSVECCHVEQHADPLVGQRRNAEADSASKERATVKGILPLEWDADLV